MNLLENLQNAQEDSSMDANSMDRVSSGRAAGPSGRCHAVQQEGESWDQDEFAKFDRKKPTSVMVEYPAGSNVWYNGVPQQWTSKEVLFRIGVESHEEAPCVWIRLTSSRIWRGSNAGCTWRYVGRGSWKPKGGAQGKKEKGAKSKSRAKKRKLVEDHQDSDMMQNDDLTCTTKATANHDSDEDDMTEQCPSPLPFKGSNAVSPDGEGPKGSFRRQEQEGANIMKIIADKLAIKAEGGALKHSPASGPIDAKFSTWLYRHYCLLEKQGQLNLAPDGCNPEAGRPSGLRLCNGTHERSLKSKETSSSAGSARQRQDGSHSSMAKADPDQDRKPHTELKVVRNKSKHSVYEPPRSPSPSTPSKPADGSRRQRSSSADLDPHSINAAASLADKEAKGSAKTGMSQPVGHLAGREEVSRKGPPAGQEKETHGPPKNKAMSLSTAPAEAMNGKHANAKLAKPSQSEAVGKEESQQQNGTKAKTASDGWVMAADPSDLKDTAKPEKRAPGSHKGFKQQVSGLVETDPFTKTDTVRCKAC